MADPIMKDRVTALAGVFQAAVLVDDFATRGSTSPNAFATSVGSLFALDAPAIADIFPAAAGLAVGQEFLASVLRRESMSGSANRVAYVMSMLHLNGLLRASPQMQAIIHSRLGEIAAGVATPEQRTADDTIAKIAALYVDTFGGLRFRVQVKGEPRQLQTPEVAARIRASLFAGVRAAHLWHHLGGRRWHLLLANRRLLAAMG